MTPIGGRLTSSKLASGRKLRTSWAAGQRRREPAQWALLIGSLPARDQNLLILDPRWPACFVTTQQHIQQRVQPRLLLFLRYSFSLRSFVTRQPRPQVLKTPRLGKKSAVPIFPGVGSIPAPYLSGKVETSSTLFLDHTSRTYCYDSNGRRADPYFIMY